jgi:hypothetical protein
MNWVGEFFVVRKDDYLPAGMTAGIKVLVVVSSHHLVTSFRASEI